MSEEMMMSMMEKASTDQDFAGGLVTAVGDHQGPQAIKAIADYGQANGFMVTEADVASMQTRLIAATAAADGEDRDLDDSDLDNVAGGVAAAGVFDDIARFVDDWTRPLPKTLGQETTVPKSKLEELLSPINFFKQW